MKLNNQSEYNWNDSFEVCLLLKDLHNQSDKSEAISRTIINRAYFSAYGKVSQYLRISGIYDPLRKNNSNSGHQDLINKLFDITDPNLSTNPEYVKDNFLRKRYKRIARLLKKFVKMRISADYSSNFIIEHLKNQDKSIVLAKYIFDLIYRIENNIDYDHIKEAEPDLDNI